MKSSTPCTILRGIALLIAFLFSGSALKAEWQLVTDFSNDSVDTLDFWKRFPPGGIFFFDSVNPVDPTNRGLYMDSEAANEGRANQIFMGFEIPGGGIPDGASASLKFDFYAYGSAFQFLTGLSDVPVAVDPLLSKDFGQMTSPNAFGDYESQVRLQGTFDVRDGNQFRISDRAVPVNEWITVYVYTNNAAGVVNDTFEIFIKTAADSEPQPLVIDGKSQFTFRNGTTDPLTTLLLTATKGVGDAFPDPWVIDNIYIDTTGRNPEIPSGLVLPPTRALGYPLVDGWINTENWMGWLYALETPIFYSPVIDSWLFVVESSFTAEAGAWTFFYYDDAQTWSDWTADANGFRNTGKFLQWLFMATDNIAFSYSLQRWIYLIAPGTNPAGVWAWVLPEITPVRGDYFIPPSTNSPLVDGVLSAGEWDDANSYPLTYDALVTNGKGSSSNGAEGPRAEANVHMKASRQGIYLAFEVTDSDVTLTREFGTAGNNSDAIQVGFDLNPDPANQTSTVLFDFNPGSLINGAAGGPTNIFARWAAAGYDPAWGVRASSNLTDTGYNMEIMVPWSFLRSFGVDNSLETGSTLRMTFIVVDGDETGAAARTHLWDTGNGVFGSVGVAGNWPIAAIADELPTAPNLISIPKNATAPVIDGTIGDGEWLLATHSHASYANWVLDSDGASNKDARGIPLGADAPRAFGDFFLSATDEALYLAAVITDSEIFITSEFGSASNAGDGVQLAIDMNPDPANRDTGVLWDFTPATVVGGQLTGPANIFARWGLENYDAAWGVQAAGSLTEAGYIVEVKLPWQAMLDVGFSNPLDDGSLISLGLVLVDYNADGSSNDLLINFGDGLFTVGDAATWNDAVIDE